MDKLRKLKRFSDLMTVVAWCLILIGNVFLMGASTNHEEQQISDQVVNHIEVDSDVRQDIGFDSVVQTHEAWPRRLASLSSDCVFCDEYLELTGFGLETCSDCYRIYGLNSYGNEVVAFGRKSIEAWPSEASGVAANRQDCDGSEHESHEENPVRSLWMMQDSQLVT